jgi:PAS domain S-box-containing protein
MSSIEKNPNATGNLGTTGNHFMLPLQQPGLFDAQAAPSEDPRRVGNPALSDDTPVPQSVAALLVNQANLLSQSDRSFRFLVEAVIDYAIYMLDPEGRVLTWNAGAERNKGYRADEVLGKNFSMFFLPEDVAAGLPEQELEIAEREGRFAGDGWRLRKNGTKFWAQVTLTAICGPDGKLRGFAKVTRDMTAQKETEIAIHALNSELSRFQMMVQTIDEYAIYSMDAHGTITSWGVGAEKTSGWTSEQMVGKHYSAAGFTEEDIASGLPDRELAEAARHGRYMSDEWRILAGRRLWSSGVIHAVRDESGEVTAFVRVARDMTRQRGLEESLSRQAEELEARVAERTKQLETTVEELRRKNDEVEALAVAATRDLEEKRVMLNEIHHRVKNNLQVVQSLLKMSVRSLPPGEARTVTMATAQRVFAMAMVHERLYGTKDLAGIMACTYLRDLVSGISGSSELPLDRVEVVLDCDEILLDLNQAIPFGLLVNELLSNSLKHGFPDGRRGSVTISIRRHDDFVRVACEDDGVGLPENFDISKCTSMGLKLTASLARQLGGTLTFSSEDGCRVETELTRL